MIVSPIAARMAADNGIDLRTITGSRARTAASSNATSRKPCRSAVKGRQPVRRPFTPSTQVGASAYRDEPTSKMRQVIASRLDRIDRTDPDVLSHGRDRDGQRARAPQADQREPRATKQKISVNDIHRQGRSDGARQSIRSSTRRTRTRTIRFYEQADIGVAVAIDEGLITPVVRGANLKGFARDLGRDQRPRRKSKGQEAAARGIHRCDFLDQQSRNVRHQGIHRDHQSARSRRSSRSAARPRRPSFATARSSSATS